MGGGPPSDGGAFARAATAGRANLVIAPVLLAAGLAATIAVTRALDPADFALFAVALAFRSLMGFFGDLGAGTAATRLFAELFGVGAARQARAAYLRLAVLRLAPLAGLAVVLLAAPDAVADVLNLQGDERDVVPLFGLIGVFEIISTLGYSVLSGAFQHRLVNRVTLAATASQPVFVIAAVAAGSDVRGIILAVAAASSIRGIGLNLLAVRIVRRMEESGAEVDRVARAYARAASGAVVGKLAAIVHQRPFLTFVGLSAVGRPEVAAFSLAYDVAHQALSAVANPIYSVLLPGSTAIKDDRARTERAFSLVTRVLALAVGVPAVALAVMWAELVPVVFGDDYRDAAAFGVLFLLAFALEVVLSGPVAAIMLADGSLTSGYRTVKLATVAAVVFYLPLLEVSLFAAAAGMMATRLVSAGALHAVVLRRTGMRALGGWVVRVGSVLVATAIAAALPTAAGLAGGRALALAALAAVAASVVVVRLSRPLDRLDVDLLTRALPSVSRPLRAVFGAP